MKRRLILRFLNSTLALALATWLAWSAPAWADRRVALVVGNSAYQKVTPLPNPRNDASDVSEVLRGLGFEVISAVDVDSAGFNRALGQFSRAATEADAALFFYAGHGVQLREENYFLPVDADAKDEISAEFEFVSMDRVKRALDKAASGSVRIVVLDACRDNPLARSLYAASRGLGEPSRGLARIDLQSGGAIIVYATQPNQVAQDGAERNSPFTSAFLKRLKEPGLEVGDLFRRVTEDVRAKTGGRQVPELTISLGRDYYLNRNETDTAAFDRVATSTNPQDFRDFIARFPSSARVPLAKSLADTLDSNAVLRQSAKEAADRAAAEAQKLARFEAERRAAEQTRLEAERSEAARREEARKETLRLEAVKKAEDARRTQQRQDEADRLARLEADRKAVESLAAARARASSPPSDAKIEARLEADRKAVEALAARRHSERRMSPSEP